MSYVDAGYAIALSVLALYSVSLLQRRRRLQRAVALATPATAEPGQAAGGGAPERPGAVAVGATGPARLLGSPGPDGALGTGDGGRGTGAGPAGR